MSTIDISVHKKRTTLSLVLAQQAQSCDYGHANIGCTPNNPKTDLLPIKDFSKKFSLNIASREN